MTMLLTIALMHWLALMTPGPDFFFISQLAVSRSRKEAMMGVLGITLGVIFWAGIVLAGLHILLDKLTWLSKGITLGGGAYLLFMGLQLVRSAWRCHQSTAAQQPTHVLSAQQLKASFIKGLLTNLSNPKAIIYFGSIFSLLIGDTTSVIDRWGLLALIAAETLIWFTSVVVLFSKPWLQTQYQRCAKWIDGMAGSLFIAFGLFLLLA